MATRRRGVRVLIVLLAVGLLVGTVVGRASAADPFTTINRIKAAGVLKVPVMTGEEPGYVKDPATGKWSGFYMEWLQEIADLLGVKLETVETTWGNLAADFQANKIDIAIGLNPNPRRALVVDYLSVPLFTDAWAVVARPNVKIKSWQEMNNPKFRLVVQKGSTMQVVAENLAPKAKVTVVEDRPLGVLELRANRADAMLLAVFDAIQVQKEKVGTVILPAPLLVNPATLGVKREDGNEGFVNFLTTWVLQQRSLGLAQGKLAKHWEKHGLDMAVLPPGFSF